MISECINHTHSPDLQKKQSPMSSPAHGSPGWSAEKEFALLMLLTDGNRKAAQQLWLRKVRIHREAPPDAGASAPKAATAKPQPAPARARAVPKLDGFSLATYI